jgi:phage-related protein
MCAWTFWEYRNVVSLFLDQCDEAMKEKLMSRLDLLLENGNNCERPVTAPLGYGLFELLAVARNNQARLLFYFGKGEKIIFVDAFYKKDKKFQAKRITQAKKTRDKIKNEEDILDALNYTH